MSGGVAALVMAAGRGLRVGGETPKHRTSAFVLDDRLAIDAGSLTSGLTLKAQCALEACLVSHAHLDHIRDLATLADNRAQVGTAPLVVAGGPATPEEIKAVFGIDELPATEVTIEALTGFDTPGVQDVGVPGGGGGRRLRPPDAHPGVPPILSPHIC